DIYSTDLYIFFFFSSRRRPTRFSRDWSSDVCSSYLPRARRPPPGPPPGGPAPGRRATPSPGPARRRAPRRPVARPRAGPGPPGPIGRASRRERASKLGIVGSFIIRVVIKRRNDAYIH